MNDVNYMSSKHVAVIIPSYNESKNLAILLPSVIAVIPSVSIYVIDDSEGIERDETKRVCGLLNQSVTVITRKGKLGRGSAVVSGMKKVLEQTDCEYIIEMDADLAHDPRDIHLFFSKIQSADMVIGSRYLKESSIKDWPWYRLVQSRIINVFLKYWLGLSISDYTNGFRMYKRRAAEYIVSIPLYEKGFISLSEIAYRLKEHGFHITEVPTSFTDRKFGVSNAGPKELYMSLIGAIRIRLRSY